MRTITTECVRLVLDSVLAVSQLHTWNRRGDSRALYSPPLKCSTAGDYLYIYFFSFYSLVAGLGRLVLLLMQAISSTQSVDRIWDYSECVFFYLLALDLYTREREQEGAFLNVGHDHRTFCRIFWRGGLNLFFQELNDLD